MAPTDRAYDLLGRAALAIERALDDAGVCSDQAHGAAMKAFQSLAEEFAGDNVYFPKGRVTKDEQAERAYALRAQGKNPREIAREMGVSRVYAYRLIGTALLARRRGSKANKAQATEDDRHGGKD